MKVYRKLIKAALTIAISVPALGSVAQSAVSELTVEAGRISALFNDYPLRKGLREVASQSGVTFLVDPDVDGRLNFRMNQAPLTLGLRRLLSKFNHVIMQGRDEQGRLVPKLVRILRKGELTASRFDVIGGQVASVSPEGGYRNYREMLPAQRVQPGRKSANPGMSQAKRGRQLALLRSKAADLREKIDAVKQGRAIRSAAIARERMERGAGSSMGLTAQSIAGLARDAENVQSNGASQRPSDEYYLQKELQQTVAQMNELVALEAMVEVPDQEVIAAEEVAEKLSLSERLANSHRKPDSRKATINLFPDQGDKVLK